MRSLITVVVLLLSVVSPAQDEVLVNKVGTKLGTRSAFQKKCQKQWAATPEVAFLDRDKFCECLLPIVLATPAIAENTNPKILDSVDLMALLNNRPNAVEELTACAQLSPGSIHLRAMPPEAITSIRQECATELHKQAFMKSTGADPVKLCDCLVDAMIERDLTLADVQAATDQNSPMFNEVFMPCAQVAVPETFSPPPSPTDVTGPMEPTTLPVIALGKVHKVKTRIAGSEQYFIIDSGAEDCIVSRSFVEELRKSGAVDTSQQLPPRLYLMADGTQVNCSRYLINGIEIGPFKVDRVVVASFDQNIQYLLGKSFLNKFKEWKVDETGKTITLLRR